MPNVALHLLVIKYHWPGSIIPEPGASEQRRSLRYCVRKRRALGCAGAKDLLRVSDAVKLAGGVVGYAACTSVRKRRTSPSRLSASCESVSASDLTSAATVRASREVPARRLMASLLLFASAEARLTPSLIEAMARFCSSTVTSPGGAFR